MVQPGEALGAVVASVPRLGYWLVYLKTITGLASVILAATGMWLLGPLARELDFNRSDDAGDGTHSMLELDQPATESARIGALSGV